MYAQTVPLRRNTYGIIIQDAPEGQSLLNRWVSLLGDTFRALWEKSADVASAYWLASTISRSKLHSQ